MKKIQKIATSIGLGTATLLMNVPFALALDIGTIDTQQQGYATDIGTLVSALLSFVMVLAALLVLGFLIMGGIEWITAGGDKGKTESARNKITGAIIGLIILAASFAILQLILSFLGFENLNQAISGGKNIRGE
jgi:cytochrome bd-type quinol oxidase subunit 2